MDGTLMVAAVALTSRPHGGRQGLPAVDLVGVGCPAGGPDVQPSFLDGLDVTDAIDVTVLVDVGGGGHVHGGEDGVRRAAPWLQSADILFCGRERLSCPAPEWIHQMLTRHPWATVAAVGGGAGASLAGLRDGRIVAVHVLAPPGTLPETHRNLERLSAALLHGRMATATPVDTADSLAVLAGSTLRCLVRSGTARWDRPS